MNNEEKINKAEKAIRFLEFIRDNIGNSNEDTKDAFLVETMINCEIERIKSLAKYDDYDAKFLQIAYLAEEAFLLSKECQGSFKQGVEDFFMNVANKVFIDGSDDIANKKVALDNINSKIENGKKNLKSEYLELLLKKDLEFNTTKRNENKEIYSKIFCDKVNTMTALNIERLTYCEDIVFLPKDGDLYVIGDTHGDSKSANKIINEINSNGYIVFLGDYVNNGLNSIGNLITVLELKEHFPDRVVLLSGNHEFRETYYTVLNEFFDTHWTNTQKNTKGKRPPNHYGHIRLELIKSFGIEKGEEIYELFERWGRSLPYIAFSDKGIMMSHSIGLSQELKSKESLSLGKLARAKQESRDIALFKVLGYEAWKKNSSTLHAQMVNNKEISDEFLDIFKRNLDIRIFVVGHRHYRSGDIHGKGNMEWSDVMNKNGNNGKGRFVTICSSNENSEEAGHYIEHEFGDTRVEGEKEKREKREGRAKAYYAVFHDQKVLFIDETNLKPFLYKENNTNDPS